MSVMEGVTVFEGLPGLAPLDHTQLAESSGNVWLWWTGGFRKKQ